MEYAVGSISYIVQSELLTEDDLLPVSSLCNHYTVGRVTVCAHVRTCIVCVHGCEHSDARDDPSRE